MPYGFIAATIDSNDRATLAWSTPETLNRQTSLNPRTATTQLNTSTCTHTP